MFERILIELIDEINELYDESKGTDEDFCEFVRDNTINFLKLSPINGLQKIDDMYPNPNGTISIVYVCDSVEIGNKTMSYYIENEPVVYANKKEIVQYEVDIFNDFILKKEIK